MVISLRETFAGQRVLVTGHTGFKGAWLSVWLHRLGAQVFGYSLPPEQRSLYWAAGLPGLLAADRQTDLRDRAALRQALQEAAPTTVFHLAAQPLVRKSYQDPLETLETNVIGTANLLQEIRSTPSVRAVVVVTSDKCYENREWLWPYREEEHLGGADPYSASKGCAEIVTASYRRSFFSAPGSAQIASCRAGNVFGGGDWAADRLIPDMARSILGGQPIVLRNPRSVRPWQHVLEPLRGYLMVARQLLHAPENSMTEAWNFGPAVESEIPVGAVARKMVDIWGAGSLTEQPDPNAVHEARLLRLDSSKANHRLGWWPGLTLEEGLRLTVEWYRSAGLETAPGALASVTVAQIDAYQKATDHTAEQKTASGRHA